MTGINNLINPEHEDWWSDVAVLTNQRERIGYPTQKPLALLDRIIKASSNEGDMVLDPFAGCATACVAAERLDRQWVGIDISEKAAELVQTRIRKEIYLFHNFKPIHRSDIPKRTDLGEIPNYRTHRHLLFGKQEGHGNGCRMAFPFRNFRPCTRWAHITRRYGRVAWTPGDPGEPGGGAVAE